MNAGVQALRITSVNTAHANCAGRVRIHGLPLAEQHVLNYCIGALRGCLRSAPSRGAGEFRVARRLRTALRHGVRAFRVNPGCHRAALKRGVLSSRYGAKWRTNTAARYEALRGISALRALAAKRSTCNSQYQALRAYRQSSGNP
ncbi:hypothetical protein NDU88_005800 [Pleurodeles waltl]|uniref:Uncharacterized protein n=1 Tax=Pleurodeles waltl TaxID=8319 RepID=A0AAV7WYW7_PLEWA|nr:hypothetical protein NDU88_005800 [Pleurodeles waltl]